MGEIADSIIDEFIDRGWPGFSHRTPYRGRRSRPFARAQRDAHRLKEIRDSFDIIKDEEQPK